jgi:hypothetical protein
VSTGWEQPFSLAMALLLSPQGQRQVSLSGLCFCKKVAQG